MPRVFSGAWTNRVGVRTTRGARINVSRAATNGSGMKKGADFGPRPFLVYRVACTTYAKANPIWATNIMTYMWVQEGWFSLRESSSGRRTMRYAT